MNNDNVSNQDYEQINDNNDSQMSQGEPSEHMQEEFKHLYPEKEELKERQEILDNIQGCNYETFETSTDNEMSICAFESEAQSFQNKQN